MFVYPDIDPVAFAVGPLPVHWYGLMYLVAFVGAGWLAARRVRRQHQHQHQEQQRQQRRQQQRRRQKRQPRWSGLQIYDLVYFGAIGAVLGGRVGSALFYNFDLLLQDPLWLLRIWEGGMSFHGGMLGVLSAFYLYARHLRRDFLEVVDFAVPFIPFGLGAGRLGNFLGGELWGRPTDLPWGMVFPHVDMLPRHPSQLYELALEGVLLFVILWWFSSKPRPRGAVTGLFGLGYGAFRFGVEFLREPDWDLGFIAFGWLTMGQLLCIPMLLIGILLLYYAYTYATVSPSLPAHRR